MSIAIYLSGIAVILSLLVAFISFKKGVKMPGGNPKMQEIAQAIREGAKTFLRQESNVSIPTSIIIALILTVLYHPIVGLCFIVGAACSQFASIIGMRAATIYNERVTETARRGIENGEPRAKTENAAGNVALLGGSIMGFAVGALSLLGLLIVWLFVGSALLFSDPANLVPMSSFFLSFLPIKFVMFVQALTALSLGCSTIAVFNRTGGGIYTKSADMGADLVGKNELGLPEDDPRNPAVIADCVGDNVGDVAGNGADMLESSTGAVVATVVLTTAIYNNATLSGTAFSHELLAALMQFPLAYAGLGLLACILGIGIALFSKRIKTVNTKLKVALFLPALIIAIGAGLLSYIFFGGIDLTGVDFALGWASPYISSVIGIAAGVALGLLSEHYTSDSYNPTKELADTSRQGPAIVVVAGLALGLRSCLPYGIVLGGAILLSSQISGIYGVSMAAVGMLSFIATACAIDSYGPIADNAGGIAEMSELGPETREITDSLDSLGNTTAAIGKGLTIGSGVLCALSMLYAFTQDAGLASLDLLNPFVLVGCFIGASTICFISGDLLNAVRFGASKVGDEIRRQTPIIQSGGKSDPNQCVGICTKVALKLMANPILVAICIPVLLGIIGGPAMAGSVIAGAIIYASNNALSTANSGGAWDNAKKYVKTQKYAAFSDLSPEDYTAAHAASVVGDTVGDPYKDVVGPNMNIMIKIIATVSILMRPIFAVFSLLG